jgi:hypothetical protein
MTDVTTGHGSELWVKIGSAPLVKVAEIDEIPEEPNFTTTLYDTTSFDSQNVKDFKKHPLKEGAELTISGNRVLGSAAATTLAAMEASSDPLDYKIVLPQGADVFEATGKAVFYNYKKTNPGAEKRRFMITMKPTSAAEPVKKVA